jgi:hypothetical protein
MSHVRYSLLYDVTAHHRKHISRERYTLLCDVIAHAQAARALQSNGPCADTKKTLPPYRCVAGMLERVYRAATQQCFKQIRHSRAHYNLK